MKKVLCRSIDGKRYQVSMIQMPDKIDMSYELVTKSKSLDQFSQADQVIFRKMERELPCLNADFAGLEEQLNRL